MEATEASVEATEASVEATLATEARFAHFPRPPMAKRLGFGKKSSILIFF